MNSHEDTVKRIAEKVDLPRGMVKEVLKGLEEVANEDIANLGEFRIKNIMTIKSRIVPKRMARDPMTGERREFPAVKTLVCKTSRPLMRSFKEGPASAVDSNDGK